MAFAPFQPVDITSLLAALEDDADAATIAPLRNNRVVRLQPDVNVRVRFGSGGGGGGGGQPPGGAGLSPAEQFIIMKESGGRTTAKNPKSTAFGLGQLLLANRKKYLGADYNTTDYNKQLQAFRAYVRDRYGTAERAVDFWKRNRWY